MNAVVMFGKAIADPTRVRILSLLRDSELCVCELVDALEVGQSTLSTHLQMLRIAGIVETEKRGTWTIYRIGPGVRQTIESVFGELEVDDRIERDRSRMLQRLGLRVDGCCVVGTPQLDKQLIGEAVK